MKTKLVSLMAMAALMVTLGLAALSPMPAQAAAPAGVMQSGDCPVMEVSFGPYFAKPDVIFSHQNPEKPLVAGQSDGIGLSGNLSFAIDGVTVTTYEQVSVFAESSGCYCDSEACVENPAGNGGVACYDEQALGGHWYEAGQLIGWECQKTIMDYPDQIVGVRATAVMTPETQEWIKEGLSTRYPEANVVQTSYNMMTRSAQNYYECLNARCNLSYYLNGVWIFDPGKYRIVYTITTAGTPVTLPRTIIGTAQIAVPEGEAGWFGPTIRDYFEVYALGVSGR